MELVPTRIGNRRADGCMLFITVEDMDGNTVNFVVTPSTYALMKKSPDVVLDTDVGQDMRLRGVIGILDGAAVVKVPAVRLPKDFGFMLCHPSAAVCPVKLEDFGIHQNPPGISGSLIEGRICYDTFVLDNKKSAIYYQSQPADSGKG